MVFPINAKPMRYRKKNKLPSLNSSDLVGARGSHVVEEEDTSGAEDEQNETLEERNQRILEEDTRLVMTLLAEGKIECPAASMPYENPIESFQESCQEEQKDGFEVLEAEEDWSILDGDDDRDEVSSQWTFATENQGTFLKAVVNGDVPLDPTPITVSNPTKLPKQYNRKSRSKATDDYLDFEGEYLAYKGDGLQGRARGTRRHRKGRG